MRRPGAPEGFAIGHWTDAVGVTGCTAVIAPPGSSGGVDVRGGGPGTRETDVIGPLAGGAEVSAVMLSGGSAFGLATADGAMRWLDERGRGYVTPGGRVPIVPAIIYDLVEGDAAARPDAPPATRPARPQRPRCRNAGGSAPGRARRWGRSSVAIARRPRGSATRRRVRAPARPSPRSRSSTPSGT